MCLFSFSLLRLGAQVLTAMVMSPGRSPQSFRFLTIGLSSQRRGSQLTPPSKLVWLHSPIPDLVLTCLAPFHAKLGGRGSNRSHRQVQHGNPGLATPRYRDRLDCRGLHAADTSCHYQECSSRPTRICLVSGKLQCHDHPDSEVAVVATVSHSVLTRALFP